MRRLVYLAVFVCLHAVSFLPQSTTALTTSRSRTWSPTLSKASPTHSRSRTPPNGTAPPPLTTSTPSPVVTTAPPPATPISVPANYPVGTVSLPDLTMPPTTLGPFPPTTTAVPSDEPSDSGSSSSGGPSSATPSPAGDSESRRRNHLHLSFTVFPEPRFVEAMLLISEVVSTALHANATTYSAALRQLYEENYRGYYYHAQSPFEAAYTSDAIFRRLLPVTRFSDVGIGRPSRVTSGVAHPCQTSLSYGSSALVPLLLLGFNATATATSPPNGGGSYDAAGNLLYPTSRLSALVPSALTIGDQETDQLCAAIADVLKRHVIAARTVLVSTSTREEWILNAMASAECVNVAPRQPVTSSVGVNGLWVAFILMAVILSVGSVYAFFMRSRADRTEDIEAEEKEALARAAQHGSDTERTPAAATSRGGVGSGGIARGGDAIPADAGEEKMARLDAQTDVSTVLDDERNHIISRRQRSRIEELVHKVLTGEATIYGVSEAEREMVTRVINHPRFDGGRLSTDTDVSVVAEVLAHDRLYRLPPQREEDPNARRGSVWDLLRTKVKRGEVTSASFAATLGRGGGAVMVDHDKVAGVSATDLEREDTLTARMQAAATQPPQQPPLPPSSSPPTVQLSSGNAAGEVPQDQGQAQILDSESLRVQQLITGTALRSAQRHNAHHQPAKSGTSSIKDRLRRVMEEDDEDAFL